MAKIFLDTNYFIDALHRRPEEKILDLLEGYIGYISTLSIHIYCYIFNVKVPDATVTTQLEKFTPIDFSSHIAHRGLKGPTLDFEDNVQLHSAAEADCDLFLTSDQKLLGMKYFGKVQIISPAGLKS